MASQDWFSKNFPTLIGLVNLLKDSRARRRRTRAQSQRRREAAQQGTTSTGEPGEPEVRDPQQAVPEPPQVREEPVGAALFAPVEAAAEQLTVAAESPVGTAPSTPMEAAGPQPAVPVEPVGTVPSPPFETTRAQPAIPAEPVGFTPRPSAQRVTERVPVHEAPAARPMESRERTVPETPAPGTESTRVAHLPDLSVELEPHLMTAREQLQSFVADRNTADELRRQAQEALEQAGVEWEEAGRLLDLAESACERGVTLGLPGFASRLRMIKEIQDRRKTQAQLRSGSNDDAWEQADHARHRATAEWDKARAALEAAALQAKRESAEAHHLATITESLISSALEDVNRARAIHEDLVRLGRESFSLLGATSGSDEASPENMLMPEPISEEIEAQQVSQDLVQASPHDSDEVETAPLTAVTEPQIFGEQPESLAVAEVVEPIPASPAQETVEVILPPSPPEIVEPAPMSAVEALRREMEAAASAVAPPARAAPLAGSGMEGPGTEPSASIIEELERGLAALRPLSTSPELSEAEVSPPLGPEAVSADARGIQTAPQDLTFQPDVDARTSGPTGGRQQGSSSDLAESYSGRLYLTFPSSLDQNDLENVWEVLDDLAGSGAIVDNRMISREAGIQFTLELKDKALSMEQLRTRMPGVGLVALEEDRLGRLA